MKYLTFIKFKYVVTRFFVFIYALMFSTYTLANTPLPESKIDRDRHTYSNYREVTTTHLFLDLTVDFNTQTLSGFVELDLQWNVDTNRPVVLDTRDVIIDKVLAKNQAGQWAEASYAIGKRDHILGSKLTISNAFNPQKIRVYYQSQPQASGLQWLTPDQTAGKIYPFVYSQNQAIHARSWIPSQDTPSVRSTYSARIHNDARLVSVMSANNDTTTFVKGTSFFSMPEPIPAYLIALAVGDLEFKGMSKQTGIYAESSILAAALAEFDDTQAMIDATEALYGEYRWGRYDLLILPPSFPYGGMENPRLSFITPTVIAGDKSLVNLIAHELAHSWSGNLVTNATWQDLWLNEGFTTYVENRIMASVFGQPRANMELVLNEQGLHTALKTLPQADTLLYLSLDQRNPDEAFTAIPYTKGQLFLLYLEQKFGKDYFDRFVRQYFKTFAFKSVTTAEFEHYLYENLLQKYPQRVSKQQVKAWLYSENLPQDFIPNHSNLFQQIDKYSMSWQRDEMTLLDIPTSTWTIHEWLHFINALPGDLSHQALAELDEAFNFTGSTNAEVAHAWYFLAIGAQYDLVYPAVESYLLNIGRRKLIVPLYQQLSHTPAGLAWAQQVYKKARPAYHSLARSSVEALIWDPRGGK